MKNMAQLKKMMGKKRLWLLFLIIFLFSISITAAQNEVVVIPLFDDSPSMIVPKTGQTTSYSTGDDGDLQKGVAWPIPRFTDNGNGTVTDNFTKLIWLKDANCFGNIQWATALSSCNTLNSGECGLTDGSVEGDWRLPNVRELHTLVDFGQDTPALPSGSYNYFSSLQSYYWSSTTNAGSTGNAWYMVVAQGYIYYESKTSYNHVWPVRGGN